MLSHLKHGFSFSLLVIVTLVGAAIPLVVSGLVGALISAPVFGSAFFAVVAATKRTDRDRGRRTLILGQHGWLV